MSRDGGEPSQESRAGDFAAKGYAVLPSVLAGAHVARWRELVRSTLEAHRAGLHLPPSVDVLGEVLCLHHPHKLEPAFMELAREAAVVEHLVNLVGPGVKCVQSQAFVKPPGSPGNAWHQDEAAIPTRDASLVAAWFALDDADRENGCLRVVPGSHRRRYLYPVRRHGRDEDFDFPTESFGWEEDGQPLDVEVRAGDVVLFHGYLVHGSLRNSSMRLRRAVTFHYMATTSLLPWKVAVGPDETEVSAAGADYRDVFVVAGDDPYAWKGYDDRSIPHLRQWRRSGAGPSLVGVRRVDPRLSAADRALLTEAFRRWNGDEVEAVDLVRRVMDQLERDPGR